MLTLGRISHDAVESLSRPVERVAERVEGRKMVLFACLCARADPSSRAEGEKRER